MVRFLGSLSVYRGKAKITRVHRFFTLTIIASLMTFELTMTESKNVGWIDTQPPLITNVCETYLMMSKLRCICDTNKLNVAIRADCIISRFIPEDHPIWASFSTQSQIENIEFNGKLNKQLRYVPVNAIVHLNKLKVLSIIYSDIQKIIPYAFRNSSTLRNIILIKDNIKELEKHSFSQMMMLSRLNITHNDITEIKRDVFFNLPNLNVLTLSKNNLSLLHEGCFKHLNNLIELNLDFNLISVMTKEMMEGLENLLTLNLRNNKMTMIGNWAFSELWGLKELFLDNNLIEYISERAFGRLTQLQKLTLAGNRITLLYEGILDDTKSLSMLDLRDNLLTTISYEAIQTVVNNEYTQYSVVYLARNPLYCDCRLSWIYVLRNETQKNTMKDSLEEISCLSESMIEILDDKNNKTKELASRLVLLTNIRSEDLPCSEEMMKSIQNTYGQPVQKEIKLKSASYGERIKPVCVFFLLMLVLIEM